MNILPSDIIKEKVIQFGFYPIVDEEYSLQKPIILCDDIGYKYKIIPASIIYHNSKPFIFHKSNPYTIDNIKLWLSISRPDFILFDDFIFINIKQKISIIDKEGYKYCVSIDNLKKSKPSKFGNGNIYTINNIALWLSKNKPHLILISSNFCNSKSILKFYCKNCDSYSNITWDNMLTWNTDCESCSMSLGELKINNFLLNNSIKFKRQYSFKDCKYKKILKFDFAIYDDFEQLLFLIEYQGEQHYNVINFCGDIEISKKIFEEGIIKDEIKREYCIKNNIKLVEIPYWEYDNIEYIIRLFLRG